MTVIPENASDSDNDEVQGQTQQGRGEDNQAEVTGHVPEGTEQAQNQGNTGATDGQEKHQNIPSLHALLIVFDVCTRQTFAALKT